MTQYGAPPSRLRPVLAGLAIAASGVGLGLVLMRLSQRSVGRGPFELLIFIVPALVFIGAAAIVRGLVWGAPAVSGANVFVAGLVMLAVGIFPWAYTPWLVGDRPGGEGAGMLGTIIFLTVGLPGVLVTIVGFLWRWYENN